MDWAYNLHGGAPLFKKYKIGITISNRGTPILNAAAGNAGVVLGTTTSAANAVGANLDTGTYATAQVAGSTPEATVSVIVNPDAVYRMRASGGATEGTNLTKYPITTASATGTTITTGEDWSNPTFDEGFCFFVDGANVGQSRKVTSVSSTAGTVTVAFANDTVVGDNVCRIPWTPVDVAANNIQFTTNLWEADASIAVGTGAEMRTIDLEIRGVGNTFVHAVFDDHIFNVTT